MTVLPIGANILIRKGIQRAISQSSVEIRCPISEPRLALT